MQRLLPIEREGITIQEGLPKNRVYYSSTTISITIVTRTATAATRIALLYTES